MTQFRLRSADSARACRAQWQVCPNRRLEAFRRLSRAALHPWTSSIRAVAAIAAIRQQRPDVLFEKRVPSGPGVCPNKDNAAGNITLRACRKITFTIRNVWMALSEAVANSSILDFDGVAEGSVVSSARQ